MILKAHPEVRVSMISSYSDGAIIRVFVSVFDDDSAPFQRFVDVLRDDPRRVVSSSLAWGVDGPPSYVIDEVAERVREFLILNRF